MPALGLRSTDAKRLRSTLAVNALPADTAEGTPYSDLEKRLSLNTMIASQKARAGDVEAASRIAKCCRILSRRDADSTFRPTQYCRRKDCAICRTLIEYAIGEDLINELPTRRSLKVVKYVLELGDPMDEAATVRWLARLERFRRCLKTWLKRLNLGCTEDSYTHRWRPAFAKHGIVHSYIAGLHIQFCHSSCGTFLGYRPHMHLTLVVERDAASQYFYCPIINWFADQFDGEVPIIKSVVAGKLLTRKGLNAPLKLRRLARQKQLQKVCSVQDLTNAAAYACRVHKANTETSEYFERERLLKEAGVGRNYARGLVSLDATPSKKSSARNRLANSFHPINLGHSELLLVGCGAERQRLPHRCDSDSYLRARLAVDALADRIIERAIDEPR